MLKSVNLKQAARPLGEQQTTSDNMQQAIQEETDNLETIMEDVMDEFEQMDEEEYEDDNDRWADDFLEEENIVDKAKRKICEFKDYIVSAGFKDLIERKHKETGIPRKTLANGFFSKCLGTIGDILGIAFNTVGNVVHTLIDVLNTVLHSATNMIVSVANGIAGFVTLNKTCVA